MAKELLEEFRAILRDHPDVIPRLLEIVRDEAMSADGQQYSAENKK